MAAQAHVAIPVSVSSDPHFAHYPLLDVATGVPIPIQINTLYSVSCLARDIVLSDVTPALKREAKMLESEVVTAAGEFDDCPTLSLQPSASLVSPSANACLPWHDDG